VLDGIHCVARLAEHLFGAVRVSVLLAATFCPIHAQRGPTTQTVAEHLGDMMPHLTGVERELYRAGRDAFIRTISVQGDSGISNTEAGLGPRFNGDSCAMCHAYPAIGGSSPSNNPEVQAARREGARNTIPGLVRPNGPILQVRFKSDDNGNLDGSVHRLFTILGRQDAQGCDIAQPDFERERKRHNLSFRIPSPLFGAGLIEAIPDSEIENIAARDLQRKRRLGIKGKANRLYKNGAIGKFGWKADTPSIQAFVAEAYATEEGVTNELFPQEGKDIPSECLLNPAPEDSFSPFFSRPIDAMSNVSRVTYFIRFLGQPPAADSSEESTTGKELFTAIGCAECHTPVLTTGKSSHPVLSEQQVALYSDLLLHHMGSGLADGIREGNAGPDEFRTAPLWGVGKRLFFLHDGRTTSLSQAILMHSSDPYQSMRSEADEVITSYRQLPQKEKDALLYFLKGL
jgi:CxxC motif-containing protein (DUF1111 family)